MLLLHVADVHFRHPECGTMMDPDRPYRTMLVRHVRDAVAELGPVSAILVGGDIAFRGLSEEYAAALAWLTELAAAAGCSLSDVFVVPGNHDVNRETIKQQTAVRNAQQAVSRAKPDRRERELFDQLRDGETGPALLAPLDPYNVFAAQFNCQVYAPDKVFWHQERPLGPFRVRFYGLTSTLLSGAGAHRNEDDTRESLYLSPLQTALDPLDGIINVVLCHHPPDWFMDHDDVEDAIRGRAALHLFGHKHRQRIYHDMSYVRLAAGAVNPDRNEPGWEPGFNLVSLEIEHEGALTYLQITSHLYSWQQNPDQFRAKLDEGGRPFFLHRVRLRAAPSVPETNSAPSDPAPQDPPAAPDASVESGAADGEVVMSEPQTRNLVLRFWSLASSERRKIAQRLNLMSDEDLRLPEPERYGRALLRASELGILDQLATEVARAEEGK